jgi:hypothetical protein
MHMLKIATIAAALMLPTTALAEMSQPDRAEVLAKVFIAMPQPDKAGLFVAIVLHGDRCKAPHSEFINWLEKIFMKEDFDDQTVKAAMISVVDRVKQESGWAAWCRMTTELLQKYTELYNKQWQ